MYLFLLLRLLLLSGMLMHSALYAKIYEYTDENGIPTFTDTPIHDAKEMTLQPNRPNNTLLSTETPNPKITPTPLAPQYTIAIISPISDAFFDTSIESIPVTMSVLPPLQEGAFIQLLLDDKAIASQADGSFILPRLERGEHHLQALVLSSSQQTLAASHIIPIHQFRASILAPKP